MAGLKELDDLDREFISRFKNFGDRSKSGVETFDDAMYFVEAEGLSDVLKGAAAVVACYKAVELQCPGRSRRIYSIIVNTISRVEAEGCRSVPSGGLRGDVDQVKLSLYTAAWHVGIFLNEPVKWFFDRVVSFVDDVPAKLSFCINTSRSLTLYAFSASQGGDYVLVSCLARKLNSYFLDAMRGLPPGTLLTPAQSRDVLSVASTLRHIVVGANIVEPSGNHIATNDLSLWSSSAILKECTRIKNGVSPQFDRMRLQFITNGVAG